MIFGLIKSIQKRDPVQPSFLEVLLAYPGVHVLLFYKIARVLWGFGWRTPARVVSHIGRLLTGIEIHPAAKIGKRFFVDHGMGVVIGETAVVEDDVTLYHGVTLGGIGAQQKGKRHPTLKKNVMVGAGAQILGDITIGEGAKVGANAVVTTDVPAGCTAVGNPARLVSCKCDETTVQAYGLPSDQKLDPRGEEIERLMADIVSLKKRLHKKK